MKKMIAVLAAAIIIAAGCVYGGYQWGVKDGTNTAASALPKQTPPVLENELPQDGTIQSTARVKTEIETIVPSSVSSAEGMTAVDTQNFEIDGVKMEVALYTSASKNTDGILEFDAGQTWVVEAKDEAGQYYTLYNQYVNHGQIYFSFGQDEKESFIAIYEFTGMGSRIMKCTFSGEEFKKFVEYSQENINVQYSSFPDYR